MNIQFKKENTLAKVFKILSYICLFIFIIILFFMLIGYYSILSIYYIIIFFAAFINLFTISEVIQILHDIRYKLYEIKKID